MFGARAAFRVPRYTDRAGLSGQAAEDEGDADGAVRCEGRWSESVMTREKANGRFGELGHWENRMLITVDDVDDPTLYQ